jgi:N-acylglucosamine 2-epimerase
MLRQVQEGWGDKLWWVHSEALYTTLLCHARTGDPAFLDLYDQVFDYTFRTFPNPDRAVREWIQIRKRDGTPQNKVVALPVKDPYHIMRNVIQIIELLYAMEEN